MTKYREDIAHYFRAQRPPLRMGCLGQGIIPSVGLFVFCLGREWLK